METKKKGIGTLAKVMEESTLRLSDDIRRRDIARQNAASDNCVTTSELAQEMGMTTRRLYRQLAAAGIVYREDGRYWAMPEYEAMGVTRERCFHYFTLEGEKRERRYIVWTAAGVSLVRSLMQD